MWVQIPPGPPILVTQPMEKEVAKLTARDLELIDENDEFMIDEKDEPLKMRKETTQKKSSHHIPKPRFEPASLTQRR